MDPYEPIGCTLHDRLEDWAVRGTRVRIRWRTQEGERGVTDHIADVEARAGAEWLRTGGGEWVRLDRLVEVEGIPFGGDA